MPCLSFIVSPYPPPFVLCTLVSLIPLLVFRLFFSVSKQVYTLSFIPRFMLIPYLESF